MISFPKVSLGDFAPLPEEAEQYSLEYIESHGAIKLRDDGATVWIGIVPDAGADVVESLSHFHGRSHVEFREIDRIELAGYLGKLASESGQAPRQELGSDSGRILIDKLANDAPIVNLVNSICIDGIRSGASDIHIEALSETVRVRYRIDGVLRTARNIEKGRFAAISSRIKIMANMNIMERRLPQDGRISVDIGDDSVDLRVSIVPVAQGESIVLRLFNKASTPLTLGQLGFTEDQLDLIKGLLKRPHGLVLVTGPTGSGKTTTLNAMLREIASDGLKVITIEDPIEYLMDGVNQIQTNDQIKLSFDTILRRVLRQDPNVIMVGEIRDSATAELSVRAALTGHLVLSTLHTNSSVSVIPRLRNMGVESYLIASVLQGAVAQRLVRKICPSCSRTRPASPIERGLLGRYGIVLEEVSEGTGCEHCSGTGFRGRTVVSEAYSNDPSLEELILRDERVSAIHSYLKSEGFIGMASDGVSKAASGITTIAELEREVAL